MLTKDEFLIATREIFSALYDSMAASQTDYSELAASIDIDKLSEKFSVSEIASSLSYNRLADSIDLRNLKDEFSASEIASEICTSDIADHVDLGDLADEVAEKLDPRDIARHMSVDTGEIIDELNYRKLASAIIAELRGHT